MKSFFFKKLVRFALAILMATAVIAGNALPASADGDNSTAAESSVECYSIEITIMDAGKVYEGDEISVDYWFDTDKSSVQKMSYENGRFIYSVSKADYPGGKFNYKINIPDNKELRYSNSPSVVFIGGQAAADPSYFSDGKYSATYNLADNLNKVYFSLYSYNNETGLYEYEPTFLKQYGTDYFPYVQYGYDIPMVLTYDGNFVTIDDFDISASPRFSPNIDDAKYLVDYKIIDKSLTGGEEVMLVTFKAPATYYLTYKGDKNSKYNIQIDEKLYFYSGPESSNEYLLERDAEGNQILTVSEESVVVYALYWGYGLDKATEEDFSAYVTNDEVTMTTEFVSDSHDSAPGYGLKITLNVPAGTKTDLKMVHMNRESSVVLHVQNNTPAEVPASELTPSIPVISEIINDTVEKIQEHTEIVEEKIHEHSEMVEEKIQEHNEKVEEEVKDVLEQTESTVKKINSFIGSLIKRR